MSDSKTEKLIHDDLVISHILRIKVSTQGSPLRMNIYAVTMRDK